MKSYIMVAVDITNESEKYIEDGIENEDAIPEGRIHHEME